MVLYELLNTKNHSIETRETIRYKDAINMINFIKKSNYFKVDNVQVFNPYTKNIIIIRMSGNCDVKLKFTHKQYMKTIDLLVELNNNNPIEVIWY